MGWVLIIYCLHKWSLPMGNFSNRKRRRTSRSALGTTRWGRQLWRCRLLEYRLHPLTTVLSGMLLYPLGEAETKLRRLNDFMAIPDELTILFVHSDARGATVLILSTALLW